MHRRKIRNRVIIATALVCALPLAGHDRKTLEALSPQARETALTALQWTDQYWDAQAGFLWDTRTDVGARQGDTSRRHVVRDTIWYAVGLMLRDQAGDRARSLQAIAAVLSQQIDDASQPYNGTFYRSPEEPHPPARGAQPFNQYDPNWREFVGTTLALLLEEYPDRLPAALHTQMEDAIARAVSGEIAEARLKPDYSNIALMHGFLWSWAGKRFQRAEWSRDGRRFAGEVLRLFNQHRAFEEYNSPTYYGVDLYALSLWRNYGPVPWFIHAGADMEARLWTDIAAFYHADLKNLCGPFDRAYGVDMRAYVSLVGLWLRTVLPVDVAPFPKIEGRMVHSDDMQFAPIFSLLGTVVPTRALKSFQQFGGEQRLRRELPRSRVATAWIGKDFMVGGEAGNTREPGGQYLPTTAHWKTPAGESAWMALWQGPRSDSRVEKDMLFVTGIGDFTFRVSAPLLNATRIQREEWALPGMIVHVSSDAGGMTVDSGEGFVDIKYREATRFHLRFESNRAIAGVSNIQIFGPD
jgi:hypothetical protein